MLLGVSIKDVHMTREGGVRIHFQNVICDAHSCLKIFYLYLRTYVTNIKKSTYKLLKTERNEAG